MFRKSIAVVIALICFFIVLWLVIFHIHALSDLPIKGIIKSVNSTIGSQIKLKTVKSKTNSLLEVNYSDVILNSSNQEYINFRKISYHLKFNKTNITRKFDLLHSSKGMIQIKGEFQLNSLTEFLKLSSFENWSFKIHKMPIHFFFQILQFENLKNIFTGKISLLSKEIKENSSPIDLSISNLHFMHLGESIYAGNFKVKIFMDRHGNFSSIFVSNKKEKFKIMHSNLQSNRNNSAFRLLVTQKQKLVNFLVFRFRCKATTDNYQGNYVCTL